MKYRVKGPDGHTYTGTAPDNATDAQIIEHIMASPAYRDAQVPTPKVAGTEAPGLLSKIGSGVGTTLENVPGSAAQLAGGVVNTVLHPVDTMESLGSIVQGALQRADTALHGSNPNIRQSATANQALDNLSQFYKTRYGSPAAALHTLEHDPVGLLADVSTVLYPAAGIVRTTGKGAEVSRLADAVRSAADVTNPVRAMAKVASGAARIGKEGAVQLVGLSSSPEAVRLAYKADPEFRAALTGRMTPDDVMRLLRGKISAMRAARNTQYQADLANLKAVSSPVDFTPIRQAMDDILKEENIAINPDGTLNFGRSKAVSAEPAIRSIYQDVTRWAQNPGDHNVEMLDVLKQRIRDNFTQSPRAQAITKRMADAVDEEIRKSAPQYGEMMKHYADATETINAAEHAFSTRNPASADTAIRRLLTTLKEDVSSRRERLHQIDNTTGGTSAASAAAGLSMRPYMSRRLMGVGEMGGSFALYHLLGYKGVLTGLLSIASPHMVGSTLYGLGWLMKKSGADPTLIKLTLNQLGANASTMRTLQRINASQEGGRTPETVR